MKRTVLYILLLLLLPIGLSAQVTVSGSTGADAVYPTLAQAFTAINGTPQTGNNIQITITSSTSETASAILNAGTWTSLNISPTVSGIIISGNLATPLIDLNGADNVTIDGSVNGTKDMIIDNTSTANTAGTSTIRFRNDASNNTIKYCIIKGSETVATAGILFFSTTNGTTGNDGNLIDNNDITSSATNRPLNAVYSQGSVALDNSGNTISNNNIYDFLNPLLSSNGIFLNTINSDWNIENCSFYETTSLVPAAHVSYYVIRINTTTEGTHSINGNFIGGSSSLCGGTAWMKTNVFNNAFYGIYLSAKSGTLNDIQNNTIRNIDWSNSSNIVNGSWHGIYVRQGDVNCHNNNIGSITLGNPATDGCIFYGIYIFSTAGNATISNNTIGSELTANSILANSASTGYTQVVYGIYNAGPDTVTIRDNIIANMNNGTTNSTPATLGRINGIYSSSGTNIISNNKIHDLTIGNANSQLYQYASVCGIALTNSLTSKKVTGNTIYNLSNSNSSLTGGILGIYFTGSATGNKISENFIHSLSVNNSSTAASIFGIRLYAGSDTLSNNIISLSGDSQTTIYGIYETETVLTGTTNHLFFNTIYIGGTSSGANRSYALYSAVTDNSRDFRNNILENARSTSGGSNLHYAAYIAASGGTITCDYNDYWTPGTGGIPGYYGANKTSLPIVDTQDLSSLTVDPIFASPGGTVPENFKPTNCVLAGVAIPGFTIDFTGDPRTSPSMGAFEVPVCRPVEVYKANVLQASYSRLKGAFDSINSGFHTGSLEIRINGSITESASTVINASGIGNANYTSIVIHPTKSGVVISGNLPAPLIDLNGADNITIDGRVDAAGGAKDMIITNTNISATSGTSTIRLINGATGNTIKYCILKGSETTSTSGVLFFSTSNGTTGNSNNIFDNNDITNSSGSNRPLNAIYSLGTAALENSDNTISNNNIYDFLNAGLASTGIYLSTYNTGWSISGNSLYEKATFTPTASVTYYGIRILNTGVNDSISHNFIGGTAPLCGGSPLTKTNAFNNIFYGIYLNAGTGTFSDIHNNKISNINWSNSLNGAWTGIHIAGGDVNVGNTGINTGNTIGATTGADSVLVTCATTPNNVYGINIASTGIVNCLNNKIGAITVGNVAANGCRFYGINLAASAGTITISHNTIGSTLSTNSIFASSASTAYDQTVFGIYDAGSENVTISDNIIANLNNGTTNSTGTSIGKINGIYSISSGINTISGNQIYNLTIGNANTATTLNASVIGIVLNGPAVKNVSDNEIHNLSNIFPSFAGGVLGIYFTGSTVSNEITRNFIHNLSSPSSSGALIYGIRMNAGSSTFSNNIINLGDNTTTTIYGIYETGSAGNNNNLIFNTIYIGGAPTGGNLPSYAFYSNTNTNIRNFVNNIFVNARSNNGASGKNYAIRLGGITTLTINYNDYFTSGNGGVLGSLAGDKTTLGAWSTATGQDAQSQSMDPVFVTAGGNLAVDYIPHAILPGVDGTGITLDFHQITRGSPPTMGAWESLSETIWKGTISEDWAIPANWSGGAVPPDSANIAFDPSPLNNLRMDTDHSVDNVVNTTSYQLITSGHKLSIVGSLSFSNGALIDASATSSVIEYSGSASQSILPGSYLNDQVYNLAINNPNNVTLTGSLNLLNALTASSGDLDASTAAPTLIYGGTSIQTLSNSPFLDGRVYNLTIDNSAGVSLNSDFLVDNEFTINPAGIFTINPPGRATFNSFINNGTINLNSTSESDIFSMIINNYSGTGIANVQLFLTGGGTPNYNWHYVAVPVDGISKTYFTDINNVNLLAYDDSRVVTRDYNGWYYHDGHSIPDIAPSAGFSTLAFGRGYNFFTWTDATVNFNGMPSLGTTLGSIPLQYSGSTPNNPLYGLNLLGNSLTSSLDWEKVTFSGPVGQAVHYTSHNQWVTYLQGVGGTNGATKDIPPLQGFIVQATGIGASIDLSDAREHSNQPRYKKSGSSEEPSKEVAVFPKVKLELAGPETSDETLVWCSDAATTGYDDKYDASKLFSSDARFSQLYSLLNGINYTINGIPTPDKTTIIPLGLKIASSGNYSIKKKDFVAPAGYKILLIDKVNNNFTVNLENTDEYSFVTEAGTFTNRFIIKFLSMSPGSESTTFGNNEFNIYGFNGMINIIPLTEGMNDSKGEVKIFDLTGRIIKNLNNIEWHEGTPVQIPFNDRYGIYIVEASSGSLRYVGKVYMH